MSAQSLLDECIALNSSIKFRWNSINLVSDTVDRAAVDHQDEFPAPVHHDEEVAERRKAGGNVDQGRPGAILIDLVGAGGWSPLLVGRLAVENDVVDLCDG